MLKWKLTGTFVVFFIALISAKSSVADFYGSFNPNVYSPTIMPSMPMMPFYPYGTGFGFGSGTGQMNMMYPSYGAGVADVTHKTYESQPMGLDVVGLGTPGGIGLETIMFHFNAIDERSKAMWAK